MSLSSDVVIYNCTISFYFPGNKAGGTISLVSVSIQATPTRRVDVCDWSAFPAWRKLIG